jgi:hypothetical protein
MTASHMFYNGMTVDISTNYEYFLKEGKQVEYDINDPGFQAVMQLVALGSKATFSYEPNENDIKTYIARKKKVKATSINYKELSPEEIEQAKVALLEAEANLPL